MLLRFVVNNPPKWPPRETLSGDYPLSCQQSEEARCTQAASQISPAKYLQGDID